MSSTCATCGKKAQDYPIFWYMCDDYFCSENCHLQKHAKPWQKYRCFVLLVLDMEFVIIFSLDIESHRYCYLHVLLQGP